MNDDLLERMRRRRLFEADDLTPSSSPAASDPPSDLGKFALVSLIGRGGMGEVWKAWSKDLKRHVAIKFVRGTDADDEARFVREAEIAAGLNHPGIVPVHEIGRHEGRPYIVMPLLEGVTVDRADLAVSGKVRAVRDAATALDAAHRQGVVHRDVKPSNLMIVAGRVHVMDFGVARLQRVDGAASRAGAVIGTPQFMSPEQARGGAVDARADVYGLGATLHALLTGKAPFDSESVFELLRRVQEEEPAPIPGADRDLQTIVSKCLEKDPGRRYATAAELAADLDRYLEREPVLARRAGWGYRLAKRAGKHRRGLAVVAGAVVVAAFVLIPLGRRLEDDRIRREAAERRRAAIGRVDLARQRLAAREFEAARLELAGALQAEPTLAEAHLELGRAYAGLGRPVSARESFSAAIEQDARLAPARLERALLDLIREARHDKSFEDPARYAGAREDLEQVRTAGSPFERQFAAGLLEFLMTRYREAASALKQAADLEPANAAVWEWLGHSYLHALEHEKSVDAFERSLRIEPDRMTAADLKAQARGALAAAMERRGRADAGSDERRAAIRELDEVIARKPAAGAYFQRAILRRSVGDVEGSIADYTETVKREPQYAEAYNNRGTARKAIGDVDGAMADFEEALRLNPRLVPALVNRANVHLKRQAFTRAVEDCTRAIEIDPTYASAWSSRGDARTNLREMEAALKDLDEALRLDPRYPEAFANRGYAREVDGALNANRRRERLVGAAQDYAQALEVAPPNWVYRDKVQVWLKRAQDALRKMD